MKQPALSAAKTLEIKGGWLLLGLLDPWRGTDTVFRNIGKHYQSTSRKVPEEHRYQRPLWSLNKPKNIRGLEL